MKKILGSVSLSAIVLACAYQPAIAQQLYAEQSSAITDLRYSLVDLEPADQMAPSVIFRPGRGELVVTKIDPQPDGNQYKRSQTFDINFPGSSNESLSAFQGQARGEATVDGVKVSTSFTSDAVDQLVPQVQHDPRSGYDVFFTATGSSDYVPTDPPVLNEFTLGAHSSLVIEGTLALEFLLSPEALVLQNLAADQGLRFELRSYLYAEVAARLQQADGTWEGTPTFAQAGYTATHSIDAEGIVRAPDDSGWPFDPGSTSFRLVVSNDADEAVQGRLSYWLSSTTVASAGSLTPNVPEPATWASFALGLGFLGAAVARQRKHAV